MANTTYANGFRAVDSNLGNAFNARCHWYYKNASGGVVGVGDPVIKLQNTSEPSGMLMVRQATTGSAATGVVVAIRCDSPDQLYLPGAIASASTGYVLVCDDPFALYEVWEGGSATALTDTAVGQTINSITAVNASTTYGSKMQIDNNALDAGDSNTWYIVAPVFSPGNDLTNSSPVARKWTVRLNLSTETVAGAASIAAAAT